MRASTSLYTHRRNALVFQRAGVSENRPLTDEHLALLKSSIDQVVLIEAADGERILAQILFVFEEGDTPDVFYLKVSPGPDGTFVPEGSTGHSVLLADIAAVHPYQP
jgi:hypothetical protein